MPMLPLMSYLCRPQFQLGYDLLVQGHTEEPTSLQESDDSSRKYTDANGNTVVSNGYYELF